MGVGKTAVCQTLKKKLPDSIFLDGDWCWDAHPFQVTEETKAMVLDNICYLLNNFIRCSAYENIIFCWVMHEQGIIDHILKKIHTDHCHLKVISLVCSKEALVERLQKDIENGTRCVDAIQRSIAKSMLYQNLDTVKIDTSDKSIELVAQEIEALQPQI